MPTKSDATRGSAAKSVAERAVSMVDTRTRHADPPVVEKPAICISLSHAHARDETPPAQAVDMAVRAGDLVAFERDGRTYLGLPDPDVFRAAFDGEVTPERVRGAIAEEADSDGPRKQWIGALNELLHELEA